MSKETDKRIDEELYGWKDRWFFCEDGLICECTENRWPSDCACCLDNGHHQESCNCVCHKRIKTLKTFISTLLEERDKEIVEMIEGKKKIERWTEEARPIYSVENASHNKILKDIIKSIEGYE